jgi:hypothetical protein
VWPTLGVISQGPGQPRAVPPEGARVKRPSWNRHRIGAAHSFILRGRFQALATTASLDMCPPMGVDEGVPSWAVLLPWASQRRQQGAQPRGRPPQAVLGKWGSQAQDQHTGGRGGLATKEAHPSVHLVLSHSARLFGPELAPDPPCILTFLKRGSSFDCALGGAMMRMSGRRSATARKVFMWQWSSRDWVMSTASRGGKLSTCTRQQHGADTSQGGKGPACLHWATRGKAPTSAGVGSGHEGCLRKNGLDEVSGHRCWSRPLQNRTRCASTLVRTHEKSVTSGLVQCWKTSLPPDARQ